jgi:hypothetical protein
VTILKTRGKPTAPAPQALQGLHPAEPDMRVSKSCSGFDQSRL